MAYRWDVQFKFDLLFSNSKFDKLTNESETMLYNLKRKLWDYLAKQKKGAFPHVVVKGRKTVEVYEKVKAVTRAKTEIWAEWSLNWL